MREREKRGKRNWKEGEVRREKRKDIHIDI